MVEIHVTRGPHPRRPSGTVVELRFRYHADVKDWVKRIIYDRRDEYGWDGGWNPDRKCWWLEEDGWDEAVREEIEACDYADVTVYDETGARQRTHQPPPQSPPPPKQRQPHEVLGVPITATLDQVKAAYLTLIKQYHPDRIPSDLAPEFRELANRRAQEINVAYDVLKKGRSR